jgi:hypothetical protein
LRLKKSKSERVGGSLSQLTAGPFHSLLCRQKDRDLRNAQPEVDESLVGLQGEIVSEDGGTEQTATTPPII